MHFLDQNAGMTCSFTVGKLLTLVCLTRSALAVLACEGMAEPSSLEAKVGKEFGQIEVNGEAPSIIATAVASRPLTAVDRSWSPCSY